MTSLAHHLRSFIDLAWPTSCAACSRWTPPATPLCEACRDDIFDGVWVGALTPTRAPHLTVHAARSYEGAMATCISAYKDDGRFDLIAPLAQLLREAAASALRAHLHHKPQDADLGWVLVPVPSARASFRERGRWPMVDLARRAAGTNLQVCHALAQTRVVADQAGLDAAERERNLANAVEVVPRRAQELAGQGVILVDDVVTTGASLASAHCALSRARVASIICASVAATPLRSAAGQTKTNLAAVE